MSQLVNFPFKNQLNEPDIDGIPDTNAGMNCLPTCIASALQYLTGKEYTGEEIEHAVYGKNYTGGTAAIEYVAWVAKQGVSLQAISSSNTNYLVEQVHEQLKLGHPVIGTIPSSYLPPADPMNPGESHCIVFYKDSPGTLIAMNPWQAFSQANTDAWWASVFCYGQVWVLFKGASMSTPNGWSDDGKTLTASNKQRVIDGFRAWVLAHDWRSDDIPLSESYSPGPGATRQDFLYEYLTWSAQAGVQSNPYGQVYVAAVSQVSGLEVQVKALQEKLASAPVASSNDAIKAELTQIIANLQHEVSNL
jgi:hypothetical protein